MVSWRRALATSTPVTAEYRLRRHDAEFRWMTMRGVPIMAASGVVREWICTDTDITDRRAAETDKIRLPQQAEGAQTRLADVFRHAPAFMCALRGPDHVYELVNDRYHAGRDVLGRTVRDALPEVGGQGSSRCSITCTRLDRLSSGRASRWCSPGSPARSPNNVIWISCTRPCATPAMASLASSSWASM